MEVDYGVYSEEIVDFQDSEAENILQEYGGNGYLQPPLLQKTRIYSPCGCRYSLGRLD